MSSLLRRLWIPCLAWSALAGCSQPPAAADLAQAGAAGQPADAGAGGADGAAGPGADTAPTTILGRAPAPVSPPGVYITSESATASGVGPCATTPLGDVLAAIRAADPTLSDIQTLYDPAAGGGDGSFIYAYDVGFLGFDIIFKRGLGDCAAGCTDNDYEYYSTGGASCTATKVGHYHAAWGTGTCLTVDGTAMWAHPLPPDPITVCGEDNSPRDLRGTYAVRAQGSRTPCAAGAAASALDATVQLVVEQDAMDPGTGSVTFSSTGDPLVDGVKLPARFQRRRFDAASMASFPPGACPSGASITAHYDFEGWEPGAIEALDFGGDACGACKGGMSVALGVSTVVP